MRKLARTLLAVFLLAGATVLMAEAPSSGVKPAFHNEVSITVEKGVRLIHSNGIPNHETGQFPGKGNPNTISPQRYEFRVPADPKPADVTTPLHMQPFGIAVNGVVFDPGAAEWWHGDHAWQYEPLAMAPMFMGTDASHAHVQPNGAYHYHGMPTALIAALTDSQPKMVIVGWAADGFPIYNPLGHADPKDPASPLKALRSSYRVKKGERPSGPGGAYDGLFIADYEYVSGLGDLDECNGCVGVTPEYPAGIYHYVLTEQFPFIPRMFRGTPDPSFNRHPPGGGGIGRPAPGFHLIPPFAEARLQLNADQKQQISELEKETKSTLAKILTPEQMQILERTRPPGLSGPPDQGAGAPGPDGQTPSPRLRLKDRSPTEQ